MVGHDHNSSSSHFTLRGCCNYYYHIPIPTISHFIRSTIREGSYLLYAAQEVNAGHADNGWMDGWMEDEDDDGWTMLSEKGCWRSILKMINLIRKSTQIRRRSCHRGMVGEDGGTRTTWFPATIKINYMAARGSWGQQQKSSSTSAYSEWLCGLIFMSVGMVHVVHHSLWAIQSIISISIDNRGWWCVFCEGQEAIVQEAINLSTRSAIGYTETDHSQAIM